MSVPRPGRRGFGPMCSSLHRVPSKCITNSSSPSANTSSGFCPARPRTARDPADVLSTEPGVARASQPTPPGEPLVGTERQH